MGASRPDRGSPGAFLLAVAATCGLLASPAVAQDAETGVLRGRVFEGLDSAGLAGTTVVLHRVGGDTTGEIDSVRTGPDGAFAFQLPTVPDPTTNRDVYFASVDHLGILYFGQPVGDTSTLASDQPIQVYDTTVVAPPGIALPVRARFLILQPLSESWAVMDLFEIENPGIRTLVAPEEGWVWRYPLPAGAHSMEVGGGDASPDAIALRDGHLEVVAPISPGVRQYLVRYQLPGQRLDASLPGFVSQVELLVPEPGPEIAVTGLSGPTPETFEGATYRRFSASGVENHRVIVLPGNPVAPRPYEWITVVLALVLAATGVLAVRTGPGAAESVLPSAEAAYRERELLLLELARVEEELEGSQPDPEMRGALESRRRALRARLRGMSR